MKSFRAMIDFNVRTNRIRRVSGSISPQLFRLADPDNGQLLDCRYHRNRILSPETSHDTYVNRMYKYVCIYIIKIKI